MLEKLQKPNTEFKIRIHKSFFVLENAQFGEAELFEVYGFGQNYLNHV
jgi:hypothetical protein